MCERMSFDETLQSCSSHLGSVYDVIGYECYVVSYHVFVWSDNVVLMRAASFEFANKGLINSIGLGT